MPLGSSMQISASGLTAERLRLDVISNNIANVNTPNFRRQEVIFTSRGAGGSFASQLASAQNGGLSGNAGGTGVQVSAIRPDMSSGFKVIHDPSHPAADPLTGNVNMPNVEPIIEMVDMMAATRAYEGGITAINAAKQMQQRALDIGR